MEINMCKIKQVNVFWLTVLYLPLIYINNVIVFILIQNASIFKLYGLCEEKFFIGKILWMDYGHFWVKSAPIKWKTSLFLENEAYLV